MILPGDWPSKCVAFGSFSNVPIGVYSSHPKRAGAIEVALNTDRATVTVDAAMQLSAADMAFVCDGTGEFEPCKDYHNRESLSNPASTAHTPSADVSHDTGSMSSSTEPRICEAHRSS